MDARTTGQTSLDDRSLLGKLPWELLEPILLQVRPVDLLALARTNRALRRLLMNKRIAHGIWRNALDSSRYKLKRLDGVPSDPAYVALLFDRTCQHCGRPTDSLQAEVFTAFCNSCVLSQLVTREEFVARRPACDERLFDHTPCWQLDGYLGDRRWSLRMLDDFAAADYSTQRAFRQSEFELVAMRQQRMLRYGDVGVALRHSHGLVNRGEELDIEEARYDRMLAIEARLESAGISRAVYWLLLRAASGDGWTDRELLRGRDDARKKRDAAMLHGHFDPSRHRFVLHPAPTDQEWSELEHPLMSRLAELKAEQEAYCLCQMQLEASEEVWEAFVDFHGLDNELIPSRDRLAEFTTLRALFSTITEVSEITRGDSERSLEWEMKTVRPSPDEIEAALCSVDFQAELSDWRVRVVNAFGEVAGISSDLSYADKLARLRSPDLIFTRTDIFDRSLSFDICDRELGITVDPAAHDAGLSAKVSLGRPQSPSTDSDNRSAEVLGGEHFSCRACPFEHQVTLYRLMVHWRQRHESLAPLPRPDIRTWRADYIPA